MKSQASSQGRLVFGALACPVCPYGVSGRCEGERAATKESLTITDPSVAIGCLVPARQRIYFSDLHARGDPEPQESRHSQIVLPPFIPQITTGLGAASNFQGNLLFSVSLGTILDDAGRVKYKTPEALRRTLKLPLTARLALIGTTNDYVLERFWEGSEARQAWKRIAGLGFEFSTSLSHSVWDSQPRFDQIFNQERNLASHDILLAHGIRSIPFLFYYNERDYVEILSWLKARSDVRKIAIEMQFHRSRHGFAQQLKEMHRLESDAARQLHFLVVGPSSAAKIDRLSAEFPRVTIVTHQPILKATRGERTLRDLRHLKADGRIPIAQLAVANVEVYRLYFSRLRRLKRASPNEKQRSMPLLPATYSRNALR